MAKKSREELLQQNTDVIYPNTTREITEEKLHDHVEDIIDSSSNLEDDNILVLKEFVIRSNKETAYFMTEINKLFYDYGAASMDASGFKNWRNYAFATFKITENNIVLHDDVLPSVPIGSGLNPLDYWLREEGNINIVGDVNVYPIVIKVYLKLNLPKITRIWGYNNSLFNIRGADILKYRNMRLKTLEFFGSTTNFPNFFANILDRYVERTGNTKPPMMDKSGIWLSGVQNSFYTARKSKSDAILRFGNSNNKEVYGRKVWNSVTENWENIGGDPRANGFNSVHSSYQSYIYSFVGDDYFNYIGKEIKDRYWGKEARSLIRVYLWRVVKNGTENCFYFTIKPLGLDTFELGHFDTEMHQLFALLDDGYSNPIIRFVDAENIEQLNANRSFRVKKENLLKSNMMMNAKTRRMSIDSRAYKTCRFFYADVLGNASRLSPKISVVTNKRGYKVGLMIDNV